MPNYVAGNIQPPSSPRPLLSIGELVSSAADAFQMTKNGILTRAIMQQKAKQQQEANGREQARFQLEQQRVQMSQRQQQNQEQEQISKYQQGGYQEGTGGPPPLGADGRPLAKVSVSGRDFYLDPNNTPEAKKLTARKTQLTAYNAQLKDDDKNKLAPSALEAIAHDETLYNKYVERHLGLGKPDTPHYQVITSPDGTVHLLNDADPLHPITVPGVTGKGDRDPIAHFTIQNVTGADNKVHLARVNTLTGEVTELPNLGKQPTAGHGGAGGVMQQMVQQHYSSAKDASERLDKFGGTILAKGQIANYIMGHNPLDENLQQANQAGEEFATLIAPLVNRGRTTHIELDQIKKSYVPLASDSKATIQQKAASRKALLAAFAKEAGAEEIEGGGVPSSPGTPQVDASTSNPFAHLIPKSR